MYALPKELKVEFFGKVRKLFTGGNTEEDVAKVILKKKKNSLAFVTQTNK